MSLLLAVPRGKETNRFDYVSHCGFLCYAGVVEGGVKEACFRRPPRRRRRNTKKFQSQGGGFKNFRREA